MDELSGNIERWVAAGLINAEQGLAIHRHEEASSAHGPDQSASRSATRLSLTEMLVYAGAALILGAIPVFEGLNAAVLGAAGRIAIDLVVVLGCASAAGALLRQPALIGSMQRAAASLLAIAVVAGTVAIGEAAIAAHLFTQQVTYSGWEGYSSTAQYDYGNVACAALIGSIAAALLVARVRAPILALVLLGDAFTAGGMFAAAVTLGSDSGQRAVYGVIIAEAVVGVALLGQVRFARLQGSVRHVLELGAATLPALITMMTVSSRDTGIEAVTVLACIALFVLAFVDNSRALATAAAIDLTVSVIAIAGRHFTDALSFPGVLTLSGLCIIAAGVGMARFVPRMGSEGVRWTTP